MEDYLPLTATIEAIDDRVADNHVFTLRPERPVRVVPGQFVEISLPGIGAFPVSSCAAPSAEVVRSCIRRAGRVTAALYDLPEGARVGLRGPFGNGFPLASFAGGDVLLLGGGLGMAPLMGLLETLLAERELYGEIIVLNGAREPHALLFREELEQLAAQGLIRTGFSVDFAEAGSEEPLALICRIGVVTGLLGEVPLRPERITAAVCGPPGMYGCVLEQLTTLGIAPQRIYATLERRMKCGVGQCCHCVTGGVYICRQGPVFSLEQLRGIAGAI